MWYRAFYGPGGPYALFAGKDASRALAKMSFEENDLTGDIEGLSPYELEALTDWEYKFMSKYVKVGVIKPSAPESVQKEAPTADPRLLNLKPLLRATHLQKQRRQLNPSQLQNLSQLKNLFLLHR